MPELPDVEEFRRILAYCAQGAVVRRVAVYDTGVLHGVSAQRLRDRLEGGRFGSPRRHGKWLTAPVERAAGGKGPDELRDGPGEGTGPVLLLHFGMTGQLVCHPAGDDLHAHDRVVWTVLPGDGSERELRYRDQRKLKGLWLAEDPAAAGRMLAGQGPDAATVTRAEFDAVLAGRRGGLKSALTDQSVVAGLGNLLADEILWRARLGPAARAGALSVAERTRLYTQLHRTVAATVRAGRVPDRTSWLTGHREGTPGHCPRCGGALRRDRMAGRGTVWCPSCQGQRDA